MSQNDFSHKADFNKNDPQITKAWAFYDWANSVYSLVITSTIFPIYYVGITTLKNENGDAAGRYMIDVFGSKYHPDTVYSSTLTISFIIIALLSPILSAIADTIGNKKSFLQFFAYLGATSCMGLAFFTNTSTLWLGLIFSILASIGFWGSLVFYNSFLPDLATDDKLDKLSARGYIYGYIGSVILVIICLFLIQGLAETPKAKSFMTRFSFLLTGAWWFGFSQYSFKYLPKYGSSIRHIPKDIIKSSFSGIAKVGRQLLSRENPNLRNFLGGYFFYSVGMQTIFLMATLFGKNINLSDTKLIATILLVQVLGICGAYIFSELSKKIGNKNTVSIGIILWILACLTAYQLKAENPNAENLFYACAALVGISMGGLQTMSRSTFSKLLPKEEGDNTKYFSFLDVLEKLAIILGTSIFGYLIQHNDMSMAAFCMTFFFVIGLVFIRLIKRKSLK